MCFRPPTVRKPKKCPKCGILNPATIKTCNKCGAELPGDTTPCPHCGVQQPVTNKVCKNCGFNGKYGSGDPAKHK